MRGTRVWARLLGVQGTIVEDVSVEEDEEGGIAALVVAVRLRRGDQGRCGKCRRRCPREDRGEGRRPVRRPSHGGPPPWLERRGRSSAMLDRAGAAGPTRR